MAELYVVEFKGSRREFYYNSYHHSLSVGDHVIVQADQGEDIGLLKILVQPRSESTEQIRGRSILRPAGREDKSYLEELRRKETHLKKDIYDLIRRHGLVMKIVDAECQFDGNKITFFFTAEHRVDFRALVRDLASRYRTRIELRQIGVRDEARRVDGYGVCGRRQCCNTFIREFAPITTGHAREQDLSLNPTKISGNCGRLLCCLRYEVQTYAEVKRKFPPIASQVVTRRGTGQMQRVDIFREEAILVLEDNTQIRVKAEEIVEWKSASGQTGRPAAPRFADDSELNGATDDALRRLDESDNSQN